MIKAARVKILPQNETRESERAERSRTGMTKRVAVLVDGDNIGAGYGDEIFRIGHSDGRVDVARVYTNARTNTPWHSADGFHLIHSGTGKNATDLMLAIDAVDMALRMNIDTIVVASSDGDFVHLHRRLRECGVKSIGAGEAKTPPLIRSSCAQFHELTPPLEEAPSSPGDPGMDGQIRDLIIANGKNGAGMRMTILGAKMHRQHGIKISERPERTWRRYLQSRPDLYDLDRAGQNAHVRLKAK